MLSIIWHSWTTGTLPDSLLLLLPPPPSLLLLPLLLHQAKRVLVVQDGAAATSAESQFAKEDIIRVRGVDFQVLGRILGNQRVSECKVEAAIPGKIATVPYWWGVDSAVYYLYNAVDPLYYWKIAALVS